MFYKFPLLTRLFVFVVLPALLAVSVYGVGVFKSLPDYDTEFTVTVIDQPIDIHRDKFGVPKIVAKTDRDLFFAMGFVQAQDRLWQMELQRRIGQGRMAEVFGQAAVSTDMTMRRYGLALAAEQAYEGLSIQTKAVLDAYSEGVNAWLKQAAQLPPEFGFFAVRPEPWRPVHSVLVGKLLALGLAYGISEESDRLITAAVLSPEQFSNLYPAAPNTPAPIAQVNRIAADLSVASSQLSRSFGLGITGAGSNAWVVSGKLSDTGRPILANDPHLALPIPSSWYKAELIGPTLQVKGMTMAGLPMILFGHNQSISWGGTNFPVDTYDFVIEQLDPARPSVYKTAQGWQPLQLRHETIRVRGDFPASLRPPPADVQITVASTVNGPLLSYQSGDTTAMALKWTALQPEDHTMTALLKLNYATDWPSFRAALSLQTAPTINYLYADQQGNIGYSAAGHVPVRRNHHGLFPTPQHEFGWDTMIPWQDMPQEFNPAVGYIVNANHKNVTADYPYHLSHDWPDPARAHRIEQLLQQSIADGKKITVDRMREMQLDQVDMNAMPLIKRWCVDPFILSSQPSLCQWDGNMQTNPAAAAMYQLTLRHLTKALFGKTFAAAGHKRLEQRWINPTHSADMPSRQQFMAALDKPELWCAPPPVGCKAEIAQAIQTAADELTRAQGADPDAWAWHDLVPRVYRHVPFSQFNSSRSVFERREPGMGSIDTVNVGGFSFDPVHGYQQNFGASFRLVIASDTVGFRDHYVNSTGQSGHPLSPHYADMLPLLTSGQLIAPTTTSHRTTLRPQ